MSGFLAQPTRRGGGLGGGLGHPSCRPLDLRRNKQRIAVEIHAMVC